MTTANFQERVHKIDNEKELWNEIQIMIRILVELPDGREVEAIALLNNLKCVYHRLIELRYKPYTDYTQV